MLKRFLAAAIGVPLIFAVVFCSTALPVIIDLAMALVCAMSVGEFAHATKTLRLYQLSIPSIVFAVAFSVLYSPGFGFITAYLYTAVMLSMMIFFHEKISFKEFAYIYSMTILITIALSSITSMKNTHPAHIPFYFLLSLGLPWFADIGAYFVGSFLGKHKLCPKISPKKTVEGAIGGVIVCILATCLLTWIFADLIYQKTVWINYLSLCLLAFVGSLFSILGDLSFSLVKRTFQIKDYGNIIMGHGGMLDRFDSVIFVAPLIRIYIFYFPIMISQTIT